MFKFVQKDNARFYVENFQLKMENSGVPHCLLQSFFSVASFYSLKLITNRASEFFIIFILKIRLISDFMDVTAWLTQF